MKRRLLALLLTLLMVFCTACGDDSEEIPQKEAEQETEAGVAYKATYMPLSLGDYDIRYIGDFCLSEDALFFAAYCVIGTEIYIDEITGEPYLDENGEPMEMDVEETMLFAMDLNTQTVTKLDFTSAAIEEGKEGYSSVIALSADGEGGFWVTEEKYQYYFDLPEDFNAETDEPYNYYVDDGRELLAHHFNSQGTKTATVSLQAGEDVYLYELCAFNGELYASDYQSIYRFDQQGEVLGSVMVESGVNMLFPYSDTQMGVSTWTEDGNALQAIDPETMALGESKPLAANAYRLFPGFGEYDYLYFSNDTFYGVPVGGTEPEKLLSWLDCDVDSSNLNGYEFRADGTVYALEGIYDSETQRQTYQMIRLDQVDASTLPQKQELTLACLGLDWDVRTAILEFNRTQDDIRIVVNDYAQYATEDDYYAGMTKLNTEILSGMAPDLFLINEEMPLETYASKGILQDLWPLIDADQELSREDLMTHFFDVLSIDGKLYQIVDSFSINTLVGRSDVVGTGDGWTLDELLAVQQGLGPEAYIFGETDVRDNILYMTILNNAERFVDWTTQQCSFDTETFIDLLELVKTFPAEFDYESFDWSNYGSEGLRLRMRRQIVVSASVGSFDMVQLYNAMCEGMTNFIGYPTADGTGSSFSVYGGLAISASCSDIDAAWEFVRTFLTEEHQTQEYMYEFPTNAHSFEVLVEQAMTPRYFETDPETGEEVEAPRNWYWFAEGDEVEIYSMTQAEYDLFMDLYEKTNTMAGGNSDIEDIITEECAAFFEGQKTAEETAKLIQDRVSLYVFEQS